MSRKTSPEYVTYKAIFLILGKYLIGVVIVGGGAIAGFLTYYQESQVKIQAAQAEAYMNEIKSIKSAIEKDQEDFAKIKEERDLLTKAIERNRIMVEFGVRSIGENRQEIREIKSLLIRSGRRNE